MQTRDYRRPSEATTYAVDWCDRCRCGRVRGAFTPQAISDFYAVPYYTHGPKSATASRQTFAERARVHIAYRADFGASLRMDEAVGESLLDIGCGHGVNLKRFSEAGFRTTGVEPDPRAYEVALQYGNVYQGTAERLPVELTGRKFDTVLLSHVLEHCQNPRDALMSVRSMLAPQGRAIIEVPNNDAIAFWRYKELWPWADVPRHLHFFTEQSLATLLGQCGFRVTKVHFTGYLRQFQRSWLDWHKEIAQGVGRPVSHVELESWRLLFSTIFRSAHRKYDSLRVHAEAVPPP